MPIFCTVSLAEGVDNLYIEITAETDEHTAIVRIENDHTNVTYVAVDGEIISETVNEIKKSSEHWICYDFLIAFMNLP